MLNRWSSILICGFFVFGVASCGSNSTPQSPPDSKPQSPPDVKPQKAPSNVPQLRTQGDSPDTSNPAPPKGAIYTIYCQRVEGDVHVQVANRIKQELIDNTKMKDWYVIHENGQSLLYYGYYRCINDTKNDTKDQKEALRAQRDRATIDLMTDPMGNRPFQRAVFVELNAPDPSAPPEWNLMNAKGAYSLQIAAYKDSPQRKETAVETVRAARAQGIEAYYYHGATSSLVCVGAWPESSVQITQDTSKRAAGNSEQPIIVAPANVDRDVELGQQFNQAGQQSGAKVVKPTITVVDPTLKAAMAQYPYNAINGTNTKHMVNGKEQYDPSLLVPIPRTADDVAAAQTPLHTQQTPGMMQNTGPAPDQPAYDPTYRPALPRQAPPPQQSGTGRLKSIGG